MPYAIPAVLAALLGGACWRLLHLRRALVRERAVARLDQAAAHRELVALRREVDDAHVRARRLAHDAHAEVQVLAAADQIITAALAAYSTTDHPRGGTDV